MKIRENVPIAELTTMRLGGPARYVLEVETPDEVERAYDFARERNLPTWIMGGGANTIGRDEGFEGVVILNKMKGIYVGWGKTRRDAREVKPAELEDEIWLTAMGGEVWDDVVELASNWGYSGIEAMSLIPGTVGAAPVQNIGAYGQDLAKVVAEVEAYDRKTGKFVTLTPSEMRMGYRQTRFNKGEDAGRFLITAVTLKLKRGNLEPPFYNSLQRYIDENGVKDFSPRNIRKIVCEIRGQKLPDPVEVASAGSFFKNVQIAPEEIAAAEAEGIPVWQNADGSGKINSGWLIETAGLKGKEFYGFKVSDKAALVLINQKAKSYADLAKARQEIIDAVEERFGFRLEQEPVELYHQMNNEKLDYSGGE